MADAVAETMAQWTFSDRPRLSVSPAMLDQWTFPDRPCAPREPYRMSCRYLCMPDCPLCATERALAPARALNPWGALMADVQTSLRQFLTALTKRKD